jgi:peptide/nickel transport system ATP-binding protein
MNSNKDLLKITDLQVSFSTDQGSIAAVSGVSLSVGQQEVLAIVGESGSGKSVTSKAILQMLPDTATAKGVIILNGNDMLSLGASELRESRGTDAAMVFQEPSTALNPVFTVGWQIAEGLRAHNKNGKRLSRRAAKAAAITMLERVGIPDAKSRVNYFPHQFSGGQKQRIVIAAALALEPKLIIADEPTTALDVTVQAEILDLLRSCRDELGASILLITHNMGVVADIADRVAVMFDGKLLEQGPIREIFSNPTHDYTKRLLAAVPRIGSTTKPRFEAKGQTPVVSAVQLEIEYPGRLNTPAFQAVKKVSFEIHPGEVVGLVGESGSGKTTIGRAIAGLTNISGGSLTVSGHQMLGFKEREFRHLRKEIGFVFQDPASSFNPLMTIEQCIAEPMSIHEADLGPSKIHKRVLELLDQVQLPTQFAERFPHELSGGQRQRASLARALALSPKLVIADEPTSALDVSVQAKVLDLFARLQKELNFASLFITHDLAVVDQVADRLLVLYGGELVEEGNANQVLANPQHPYTTRLLASHPIPDPDEQALHRAVLKSLQ